MIINTLFVILLAGLGTCTVSGLYAVLVSLYEHHVKDIKDKFQPTSFGSICFTFMLGFVLPVVNLLNFVDNIKEK